MNFDLRNIIRWIAKIWGALMAYIFWRYCSKWNRTDLPFEIQGNGDDGSFFGCFCGLDPGLEVGAGRRLDDRWRQAGYLLA